MPKGRQGPEDTNEAAFRVVSQLIGKIEGTCPEESAPDPDDLSAKRAEAGKAGGLKGGKARAENLTPERRSEIARAAAAKRWKR